MLAHIERYLVASVTGGGVTGAIWGGYVGYKDHRTHRITNRFERSMDFTGEVVCSAFCGAMMGAIGAATAPIWSPIFIPHYLLAHE